MSKPKDSVTADFETANLTKIVSLEGGAVKVDVTIGKTHKKVERGEIMQEHITTTKLAWSLRNKGKAGVRMTMVVMLWRDDQLYATASSSYNDAGPAQMLVGEIEFDAKLDPDRIVGQIRVEEKT